MAKGANHLIRLAYRDRAGIAASINDYRTADRPNNLTATIHLSYYCAQRRQHVPKRSAYISELIPMVRVLSECIGEISAITHEPIPEWIETILADNTRLNAIKRDKPIPE